MNQRMKDNFIETLDWIFEEQDKKNARHRFVFDKIDAAVEEFHKFNERNPIVTIASDLAELFPPTTKCVLPGAKVVDFTCYFTEDKSLPLGTVACK